MITNPTTAQQYGIIGYYEIDTAPGTPSNVTFSSQPINITILIHFTSYQPSLTQAQFTFDPNSSSALSVAQVWEGKYYYLNPMVSYNVSQLTIEAGQTIPILLTVKNSTSFPSGFSIPISAVGVNCITDHVTGIDNELVYAYG